MPAPMPRPPPVTSATRPSSSHPDIRRDLCQVSRCTKGAARRSSPRSLPTSASPSRSSSASPSPVRPSLLAEAIHSLADTGNQGLLFLGGTPCQASGDSRAPVRLRPRALTSGRSSSRSCCSRSAARSRSTKASTSCATPTSSRTSASRSRSCSCRRRARGAVVPHRASRGEPREARAVGWWQLHPPHEEPGAARRPPRGLRRAHRADLRAHRRRARRRSPANPRWDARGQLAIGLLLVRHRDRAGDRDEGPADRRGGVARVKQAAIAHAIEDAPDGAAAHPHEDRAPRPRRAARRREGRIRAVARRSDDLAGAIDDVERRIRSAVPEARIIYIEPDVLREVDEFPEIDVPQDVDEALP